VLAKLRFNREPVTFGDEVYVPINLAAVRVDSVPIFDVYFRPGLDQPFVLYCERNLKFSEEARKRLESSRIETVYVKKSQRAEYNRYLADNIEEILQDKRLSLREKSNILYDSAQAVVEDVLGNPRSRESVQRGKDIVHHTVDFMTDENFHLEHLLRTISCDYYLYTHSVNVAAYSVALAQRLGTTDRPTLRELANGALLHDIGKSRIPAAILNKTGGLTQQEWEKVKQVPRIGYDLMKESGCLGEIALDIVLHHQERLNGRGYPDGLEEDEISVFVRIVMIADIFDALTTDRFHQKAKTTFEALQLMHSSMKNEVDQEILRKFIEMMGKP